MPKTLLAVDDSATMRRVLEITFSGDDFRVVTAANAQAALAKLGEEPSIVLIDTILGADDGYALCSEIRRRDPAVTLVLLSSRHNPYDQAKGVEAGADDFMDKPFDTQQMVDKVKKAMATRESGGRAAPPATAPQAAAPQPAPVQRPAPLPAQAPAQAAPAASPQPPPVQRPAAAAGAPPERTRSRTLMFGDRAAPSAPGAAAPPEAPREATPQPPAAATPAKPPATAPASPARTQPQAPPSSAAKPAAASPAQPAAAAKPAPAPATSVTASVNGQLAGKLGDLGLSKTQIEAVVALSREVVEKVVWEVVPQLAETLIKEEIERLTKEA